MDLSQALKLDMKSIYTGKLKNRAQDTKEHRINNRNKVMAARRQISNTPLKLSPEDPKKMSEAKPNRMDLLKKWKEQKEKRKAEEKARAKPMFKVTRIDRKTYEDVKLPKVAKKKEDPTPSIYKFAPSCHKFRVGSDIKPINFNYGVKKEDGTRQGANIRRVLDFKSKSDKSTGDNKNVNKQIDNTRRGNLKEEKNNEQKQSHVRTRAMSRKENVEKFKENEKPPKTVVQEQKKKKQTNSKSGDSLQVASPKKSGKSPKKVTLVEQTPVRSNKKVIRAKTPKARLSQIRRSLSPEFAEMIDGDNNEEPVLQNEHKDKLSSDNDEVTSKTTRTSKKVLAKQTSVESIDKEVGIKVEIEEAPKKTEVLASEVNVDTEKEESVLKNKYKDKFSLDNDEVKSLKTIKTPNTVVTKQTPVKSTEKEVTIKVLKGKTPKETESLKSEVNGETKKESVGISGKTPNGRTPRRRKSLAVELEMSEINDSFANCTAKSISPCFSSTINNVDDTDLLVGAKTPVVTAYVSPFVTMSRGKDSARKEYRLRVSKGGMSDFSPETTGPQAGATYFTRLLDTETSRIEDLCDIWKTYMVDNDLPEEPCNMINTALGQSGLLLSKRMKQFRGMIESCRAQDTDPLITCKDLHGYWDMLLTQVKNLDDRFENLIKLRENNWEEVLPEKKIVVTKPKIVKRPVRKAAVKAGSSIRDAIKAARQKLKVVDGAENVFNGGFFMVKSPSKVLVENTPKKGRKSLLKSVLTTEKSKKSMSTTPTGLVICSATRRSKSIGGTKLDVDSKDSLTPVKSILKSREAKSTIKKAVLFNEEVDEEESPKNKSYTISNENDPNSENLLPIIDDVESSRSSLRLTRSRLFL